MLFMVSRINKIIVNYTNFKLLQFVTILIYKYLILTRER